MPEKECNEDIVFLSRLTTEEKAILLGAYDRPNPELEEDERKEDEVA